MSEEVLLALREMEEIVSNLDGDAIDLEQKANDMFEDIGDLALNVNELQEKLRVLKALIERESGRSVEEDVVEIETPKFQHPGRSSG
jgi:predicted transcriptional regulator